MTDDWFTLSLTDQVLSTEDYLSSEWNATQQPDGTDVVFLKMKEEKRESYWLISLGFEAFEYSKSFLAEDPKSVNTLTDTIDRIAIRELETVVSEIGEVDQAISKLGRMLQNLRNHDQFIQKYNEDFVVVHPCHTHEQVERRIEAEIEKLQEKQKIALKPRDEETEKEIQAIQESFTQIEDMIANGAVVDRKQILTLETKKPALDFIRKTDSEAADQLERRLNVIFNQGFLENELGKLEQGVLSYSPPVCIGLRTLYPKHLEKIFQLGTDSQKEFQRRLFELREEDLGSLSPQKLVEKVDGILAGVLVERLKEEGIVENDEQLLNTNLFLKRLIRFSTKFQQQENKKIENVPGFTFQTPLNEVIKNALRNAEITMGKGRDDPVKFGKYLEKQLDPILKKQMDVWFKQGKLKEVYEHQLEQARTFSPQETTSPAEEEWLSANQKAIRFRFNQNALGVHKVLGDGICYGINFRWMDALQKDPTKKISSVDDLSGESEKLEKKPLSPRYLQANANVEWLFTRRLHRMSPSLLRKAGYQAKDHFLDIDLKTAEELVDALSHDDGKRFQLEESNGTVEIAAIKCKRDVKGTRLGSMGGHALGMQLDRKNGIYRFWDVNGGLFEYDSLQELKEAFSSYLAALYPPEDERWPSSYNAFHITQYTPL